MKVNYNISAIIANGTLKKNDDSLSVSSQKLSSGYKINQAKDDPSGIAIGKKMRAQIRALEQSDQNSNDAISVVASADGALTEVHSMLQRMNELATQSANDTNTSSDRTAIQKEVDALTSELDRIASTTQFNTQNLLDGTFKGKNLQVGALNGQKISITITTMNAKAIGITAGTSNKVNTFTNAGKAMSTFQAAISKVSTMRSALGALQNRLEHTVSNLDNISENTSSAESRIRDTDMADEMVNYSKNNILAQAGQSMLAQANQSNQGVLSLLQ